MKYIHNYKDGSFCESKSFSNKIDNNNYIIVNDEEYSKLIKGELILLEDNSIINNPNYVENNYNLENGENINV